MKQETKKTWVSPELKNISLNKTKTGSTSNGSHGESDHTIPSTTYQS